MKKGLRLGGGDNVAAAVDRALALMKKGLRQGQGPRFGCDGIDRALALMKKGLRLVLPLVRIELLQTERLP